MPKPDTTTQIHTLKSQGKSRRLIARTVGVSRHTVDLALRAAGPVAGPPEVPFGAAMVSPSREVTPPTKRQGPYCWDLERIRCARDAQLRGRFADAVRLAEAMRTDDALFTAYHARVSTQSAVALDWEAQDSDAGRAALARCQALVAMPQATRESILGTLANHGIAIGYNARTTADTDEGPSVALTLTEWPLEFVEYDPLSGQLTTQTYSGERVVITHGDGRWVVFRKFGIMPWTQDAAVLPGALLWAAHAGAITDWAGSSYSHGQPKMLAELPAGVTLARADGSMSPEARAILDLMQGLVSGSVGAGVRPAGSKVDVLANNSTAWQVFKELVTNRESAAARVYLGTDAILGSRGGAPGVDITALFGIAATRIQGDFEALERGFREGMILPWADLHGIPRGVAPARKFRVPDPDADKKAEQEASALERLAASVKNMKDAGLVVGQPEISALAQSLGVTAPCNLAGTEKQAVPIALAPTDIARVVRVREARAANGLPPLGDERDDMFIAELQAKIDAEAQAKATASPFAPPPGAAAVAPVPFSRETRAAAEDAPKAAGEVIDGDGDGKLNEEEMDDTPGMRKARAKVAKALARYEARRGKVSEAQSKADALQAQLGESEDRLPRLEAEVEDAENQHEDAKDRLATHLEEGKDLDPEDAAEHAALTPQVKDEIVQREQALVSAREAHKTAQKEHRKLERETERASVKAESLAEDDGSSGLHESLGEYADEVDFAAEEADHHIADLNAADAPPAKIAAAEARLGRLQSKAKQTRDFIEGTGDHESKKTDAGEDAREPGDVARGIITGPKGGQYYLAPSGEKVYV